MRNFKEYLSESLSNEDIEILTEAAAKLPAGTPIGDEDVYLVQYDFKNSFKDVQLKNLHYMKGKDIKKLFKNKATYDSWIRGQEVKASKLELGEPIGTMHTYALVDSLGYSPASWNHVLAALQGECKMDDIDIRVIKNYVRINQFRMSEKTLQFIDDHYDELPDWAKKSYKVVRKERGQFGK